MAFFRGHGGRVRQRRQDQQAAQRRMGVMSIRTRKALGLLLWLIFMVIYCLLAMAVGGNYVIGRGLLLELPFYVIAGIGWLPVVMLIVRWMSRPTS
jgi:uncharacterized membrane protein